MAIELWNIRRDQWATRITRNYCSLKLKVNTPVSHIFLQILIAPRLCRVNGQWESKTAWCVLFASLPFRHCSTIWNIRKKLGYDTKFTAKYFKQTVNITINSNWNEECLTIQFQLTKLYQWSKVYKYVSIRNQSREHRPAIRKIHNLKGSHNKALWWGADGPLSSKFTPTVLQPYVNFWCRGMICSSTGIFHFAIYIAKLCFLPYMDGNFVRSLLWDM